MSKDLHGTLRILGYLWAGAPVGDDGEDVVDGYFAITIDIAKTRLWATSVIARDTNASERTAINVTSVR